MNTTRKRFLLTSALGFFLFLTFSLNVMGTAHALIPTDLSATLFQSSSRPHSAELITLSSNGNQIVAADNRTGLSIQVTQTSGSNGTIIVKAVSQGTPASSSFYVNCDKRCYASLNGLPTLPLGGGIPSTGTGTPLPNTPLQQVSIPLSYSSSLEALTGEFSVPSPGTYTIGVELTENQMTISGSETVDFTLSGTVREVIPVINGEDFTLSLPDELGWTGLNLSVQNIEIITSEGEAVITPAATGNAVNSLRIRGSKAGTIDVKVNIICNGQPNEIYLTLQVGTANPISRVIEWLRGIGKNAQARNIPLFAALVLLSILFIALFHFSFIQRIPGSFVIRCECGAAKFRIGMRSPRGRSFKLYKLIIKMLKQHEDQDAETILGIASDSDNRKNLGRIRIFIVKGEDKKLHYAFSRAGNYEIIDNTERKIYPDTGRLNTKLTVYLSFIKTGNQK